MAGKKGRLKVKTLFNCAIEITCTMPDLKKSWNECWKTIKYVKNKWVFLLPEHQQKLTSNIFWHCTSAGVPSTTVLKSTLAKLSRGASPRRSLRWFRALLYFLFYFVILSNPWNLSMGDLMSMSTTTFLSGLRRAALSKAHSSCGWKPACDKASSNRFADWVKVDGHSGAKIYTVHHSSCQSYLERFFIKMSLSYKNKNKVVPTTTSTLTVPWSWLHLKQKYRGNIFLFFPSFHYNTTRCISKERPNTLNLGAALHEEDALTSSEQSFQLLYGEDTDGVGRVAVKCRVRHRVFLLQTVKSL